MAQSGDYLRIGSNDFEFFFEYLNGSRAIWGSQASGERNPRTMRISLAIGTCFHSSLQLHHL